MDVTCVFVYIDYILVFSESEEQNYKDLKKVLLILKKNNHQILFNKCHYNKDTINLLGYNVSTGELKPTSQ